MYKPFLDLTDEQKEVVIMTMMDLMMTSFDLVKNIDLLDEHILVIKKFINIQNDMLKIMVEKIEKRSEEMDKIYDILKS